MASEEAGDWREGRGLLQRNKYLYETQHGADVTLTVGGASSRKELTAHKFILCSGSAEFESMLTHWDEYESDPVVVDDVEPDVFMEMMRYLYYEEAKITSTNAMDLLYAAKKFLVYGLTELCSHFLQLELSSDKVFEIINKAVIYDAKTLVDSCVLLINGLQKAGTENLGFLKLSHESLKQVVSCDFHREGTEVDVHKACVHWANMQCRTQGKATTDENIRNMLGDIIYKIRYPTMTAKEFRNLTLRSKLLAPLERLEVYDCISSDESPFSTKFSSQSRKSALQVDRLHEYKHSDLDSFSSEEVHISCDQDIVLLGVGVYSPKPKSSGYYYYASTDTPEVEVQLLDRDSSGKVLTETDKVTLKDTKDYTPVDMWFKRPVRLARKRSFTLKMKSHQKFVSRCGSGSVSVRSSGCYFTFSNSAVSSKSCIDKGQLPRIIFCNM